MKKIAISGTTLTLLMLALMLMAPVSAWTADDKVFDDFGPRVDNYQLNMYKDTDLLMGALQVGEIDVADWEVPAKWKEDWLVGDYANPSHADWIRMYPVKSVGQREFDLCHRDEIEAQPGYVNPMTYQLFREALVHCTNKTEYVTEILKGEAVVLGTPIMPWTVWYNTACDNYYPYGLSLARAALDAAGFTQGSTGPLVSGGDNVRIHPDTGSDMQPLICYIRADDPDRMAAGILLVAELKEVGIPTTDNILPMSGCYNPVFMDLNYHVYTGGWSLSFDPDYLYDLYAGHAIPWPNYGAYDNASFNTAAAGVKYATTFAEALTAAKEAQLILTDDVGYIPCWTAVAQTAHRGYAESDTSKPWNGFVNAEGVGVNNGVSYMNAHEGNETGGTLTCGQKEAPLKLNIMRSEWTYEYSILMRIYDFLLSADPYTNEDMGWLAHSWDLGTYYNDALGKECTIMTFHLEDDVYWHDGEPFTSADVKFSLEYYKENQGWWWGNVMDVYQVQTPDDYTVVVLMGVKSYWALHWIGMGVPMFPKHIWETITGGDIEVAMPDPDLIGTGAFKYEGGETPSGTPPKEYALFSAFASASPGFFRYSPIKALGGINLQGNYTLPEDKLLMSRTVYAPNDINNVPKHPSVHVVLSITNIKVLHAHIYETFTITFTMDVHKPDSTHEITNVIIEIESCTEIIKIVYDEVEFYICLYANGVVEVSWTLTHTADTITGRASTRTSINVIKTFVGDINGDATLDVFDALELNQGFILWFNGGTYYANSDVSADGAISASDGVELDFYL